MGGIFISYRREDTAGYARSLTDTLAARFGQDVIFRDVDTLSPGVDFPEAIAEAVQQCDVLVALIGDKWLTAEKGGKRRLDDPRDFVRLEIAAALDRDILVIPVLLEHARMPSAEELPEALAELADRNALRLTDEAWRDGVGRLVRAVEARIAPKESVAEPPTPTPTPTPPPYVPPRSTGWDVPRPMPSSVPPHPPQPSYGGGGGGGGSRTALIAGGAVVALIAVGVVALVALGRDDDEGGRTGGDRTTSIVEGTVSPRTTVGRATLPPLTIRPRVETDLTVAPTSGRVGTTVTVAGSGFDPGERVDIFFSTQRVAQARADAQGSFSGTRFAIPEFAFKIFVDIVATGATSIKSASAPFQVT